MIHLNPRQDGSYTQSLSLSTPPSSRTSSQKAVQQHHHRRHPHNHPQGVAQLGMSSGGDACGLPRPPSTSAGIKWDDEVANAKTGQPSPLNNGLVFAAPPEHDD